MLLFSTILDIVDSLTKDEFISLVIEWNQKTPHFENIVPGVTWNGERNIRFGSDSLWMEISEYRNGNIVAVRYEKIENDGIVWDTDFVLNFNEMQLAIMLDRSYQEDALASQISFAVPYFVTMLVDRGYLKDDGNIPVGKLPITISDSNLQLLADVITEKKKYHLPVVYVSKTNFNENPVNAWRLAAKLKGIAHVLLQEDVQSNDLLRKLCADRNEYCGAVGIYFPNNSFRHARYFYYRYTGEDAILFDKVIRTVFRYSSSQKVERLFTWDGVNSAILTDRLCSQREKRLEAENARQKVEAEADQIYDVYEDDIEKLKRRVEELTNTNEALKCENDGLRKKVNSIEELPVILFGEEDELYPGEIKDMVLSAVSDALEAVQQKSRRADVYMDILKTNDYKQLSEERHRKIKQVLTGYTGLNKTVRKELNDLGFEILENGKHYKLVYYGDRRYCATLAKTPSENRGNKNAASDIINTIL